MSWISVAIAAYLFGAIANILDKYLLSSERISSPVVYSFYIGIFGLGALVLFPFGLSIPNKEIFLLCIFSGTLFLFGVTLLYYSIKKAQASKVVPLIGAIIPLVTFVVSFAMGLEKFSLISTSGVVLLIFGGLLISFDLPLKLGKRNFFNGFYFAITSGIVLAIAYIFFKYLSGQENFVTWYFWTRMGGLFAAVFFLFIPVWRKAILKSFSSFKKQRKKSLATGGIFFSNKIVGGLSTLLLNYAFGISSVVLVNAMVPLQYVFVLVFSVALSENNPKIFEEKLQFWDWFQKIMAIILIGVGLYLISIK